MACSCGRTPTAEAILARSAAVFTGVALANIAGPNGQSVTTFRVSETFKGPASGTIVRVLHRSGPSPSCGVNFQPGETYTLSAGRDPSGSGFSTSLCSTWMFLPQVGIGSGLIRRMRELGGK
jgi:hypothetical protein